jgi:hypothetical protein
MRGQRRSHHGSRLLWAFFGDPPVARAGAASGDPRHLIPANGGHSLRPSFRRAATPLSKTLAVWVPSPPQADGAWAVGGGALTMGVMSIK